MRKNGLGCHHLPESFCLRNPMVRQYIGSIALGLVAAHALAAAPVARDAWIRATPPGAATAAGYVRIEGTGTADRLIGARSDVSDRVEIHTHVAANGVMTMTKIEALAIPAEGTATLAPGGDHLMLIGLRGPLATGETVTFTLVFANGGEVVVPFAVRDARPH